MHIYMHMNTPTSDQIYYYIIQIAASTYAKVRDLHNI